MEWSVAESMRRLVCLKERKINDQREILILLELIQTINRPDVLLFDH